MNKMSYTYDSHIHSNGSLVKSLHTTCQKEHTTVNTENAKNRTEYTQLCL